jgi:hypothetical protein
MNPFRRTEPGPVIHDGRELGVIRDLGGPFTQPQKGQIGSFHAGRAASAANLELARRFYPQLDARSVERRDGYVVDTAAEGGQLYVPVEWDPLVANDPQGLCDGFYVASGTLVFLRRSESPATLVELEAATAEREQSVAAEAAQLQRWRRKQPQTVLRLSDLPGGGETLSLRRAAEAVEQVGGRFARDEFGRLIVSIPAATLPDTTGLASVVELETRRECARAAQILAHAAPLVIAALDAGKEPLSQHLPDEVPPI